MSFLCICLGSSFLVNDLRYMVWGDFFIRVFIIVGVLLCRFDRRLSKARFIVSAFYYIISQGNNSYSDIILL